MTSAIIRFMETHGKLVALVFLAGAIYARSEFMLASAVKEIDKLAKVMEALRQETVSLRIEIEKINTEIDYLHELDRVRPNKARPDTQERLRKETEK